MLRVTLVEATTSALLDVARSILLAVYGPALEASEHQLIGLPDMPDTLTVLAYDGETPAGCILMSYGRVLHSLGVLPAHRQRGLAAALIDDAMERAAGLSPDKAITALILDDSIWMPAHYEKLGFQLIPDYEFEERGRVLVKI